MSTSRPWLTLLGLLALVTGGCRVDGLRFYDVERLPTDECDILPQGEFCVEPEQLSPATSEVWAVEIRGAETRVFIDDEVWVVEPPAEGVDPSLLIANKLEIAAREPGPCTTETTRSFEVLATNADLTGFIRERSRLDGPVDCGDTPRGLRTVSRVEGPLVEAP